MSIVNHIKAHDQLDVYGMAARVKTVGRSGNFPTLAAAIAWLETQPHFTELASPVTDWQITDPVWNQGSDKITSSGIGIELSQALAGRPESLWLRIGADTEEYVKVDGTGAAISTATTRYDANYSAVGATNVSLLAPIWYTLLLTDDVLDEDVISYDVPMNLVLVGANRAIVFGSNHDTMVVSTTTRLQPTVNALYGTIRFENIYFNGNASAWTNSTHRRINTAVEIDGSKIVSSATDWMSAAVRLGTFDLTNTDLETRHLLGADHFLQFQARGRVRHTGGTIRIRNRGATAHTSVWTGLTTPRFVAGDLTIFLEDYTAGSNGVVFFSGSKAVRRSLLKNIKVHGSTIGGALFNGDFSLVEGHGETDPADSPNIVGASCDIVDCHFVGEFDPAHSTVLYEDGSLGTRVDTAHYVRIVDSNSVDPLVANVATTFVTWVNGDNGCSKDYGNASTTLQFNASLGAGRYIATLTTDPCIFGAAQVSPGEEYVFLFKQDATGGRTLLFSTGINAIGISAPGAGTANQVLYAEGFGALDGSGKIVLTASTGWITP